MSAVGLMPDLTREQWRAGVQRIVDQLNAGEITEREALARLIELSNDLPDD